MTHDDFELVSYDETTDAYVLTPKEDAPMSPIDADMMDFVDNHEALDSEHQTHQRED